MSYRVSDCQPVALLDVSAEAQSVKSLLIVTRAYASELGIAAYGSSQFTPRHDLQAPTTGFTIQPNAEVLVPRSPLPGREGAKDRPPLGLPLGEGLTLWPCNVKLRAEGLCEGLRIRLFILREKTRVHEDRRWAVSCPRIDEMQ